MTNPNKAKGSAFELAVVRFLAETFGRRAYRPHQEGFQDVGDVHVVDWALQAKNEARINLPGYLDDAEKQARHAGATYPAAVVKRRGKGVGLAYTAMTLDTFRRVIHRLVDAEDRLLRADPASYDEHVLKHAPETKD